MIPAVAKTGHSFKGAMAYYLHDKRGEGDADRPLSAERVAWTEVRNLAVSDPQAATRIMIATAQQQEALKAAAGTKSTGRKSAAHVYAYSLAWHPDEAGKLDKAEMLRAVDQSLKALGAEHLQAVIVCHSDQKHPHVHVILNRVDPRTGKLHSTSNDRYKLSDWANAYERERGVILTPKREEKRELREAFKDQAERRQYAAEQRRQTTPADKTKAGMLKEFQEQQKADHAQQWKDLSARNKATRDAIYAAYDAKIKEAFATHKAESKPLWAAFFREQRQRERAYFNGGLTGALVWAFEAAKHQKATGTDRGRGMLSLVFANTVSGQLRNAIFAQRQELRRAGMSAQLKDVIGGEIADLKAQRTAELAAQRSRFDQERTALMAKQDLERGKIRTAWQQIYTERGKDPATRSAPYRRRMDRAAEWKDNRTATKQHRQANPAPLIREPRMTREQLAQGIARKEERAQRQQFVSRPSHAPAPRGEAPRAAQKQAIDGKQLPPRDNPRQTPADAFRDATMRGIDTPAPSSQSVSEIRAMYGAKASGLEEKRERSRTRDRSRSRTRTRSPKDDSNEL